MIQIKKYLRVNLAIAIILPLLIASCNSDAPVMERPEKVYYDTAQRRMKANNFYSAIESLEAIEARYPFGRYAEQAQSELIYAYFMNGEDEAAHEAAEKFIRLNPRITGLNGKTQRVIEGAGEASPILEREVRILFDSNVNGDLPWRLKPTVKSIKVQPGKFYDATYTVTNMCNRSWFFYSCSNYRCAARNSNGSKSRANCNS